MTKKNTVLQILLVALSAALYQCAFGVVYLRLAAARSTDLLPAIDWSLTNSAQALGVLILALAAWRAPSFIQSQRLLLPISAVSIVMLTALAFSSDLTSTLVYGLLLLVSIGFLAMEPMLTIARTASKEYFGRIFGFGLGFGMTGEFIGISLLGGGEATLAVFVFTAVLLIATPALSRAIVGGPTGNAHKSSWGVVTTAAKRWDDRSTRTIIIVLCGVTILMMSIALLGIYRPKLMVPDLIERLAYMNGFLIVGAVLTGLMLDVNRRAGAILTQASLAAVLVSVSLASASIDQVVGFHPLSYSLGYTLVGAAVVFTYVTFLDVSTSRRGLIPWAVAGAVLRPLVEAVLVAVPDSAITNPISGSIIIALLLILAIALFGMLMSKMYDGNGTPSEPPRVVPIEERIRDFSAKHQLSVREREILDLLIERKSNPQISQELYISENTAKFHVRNILRKTGCTSRTEIIDCVWEANGNGQG